jgi:hypothetical protein
MDLDNVVVKAWAWFTAVAFIIAFIASMPPRRPLTSWLGDFFVRWGLAGILVWFVVNGLWAVRELMGMRLILPFSPLEAYLEYATVWGAVFTGLATFIFFGATLLLNAIFAKPAVEVGAVFYEVSIERRIVVERRKTAQPATQKEYVKAQPVAQKEHIKARK